MIVPWEGLKGTNPWARNDLGVCRDLQESQCRQTRVSDGDN